MAESSDWMTAASKGPTAPWKATVTPTPASAPCAAPPAPVGTLASYPPPTGGTCGSGRQVPLVSKLDTKLGVVTPASALNSRSVPVDSIGTAATGTTQENFAASPVYRIWMCATTVVAPPAGSLLIEKTTFSPFCATGSGANGFGGRVSQNSPPQARAGAGASAATDPAAAAS